MDQVIDEILIERSMSESECHGARDESQFTFELESSVARAEVTEVDESEIKQDPHEIIPEGIKYRTSQDIDRSVKKKALGGPISVMQHHN